MENNSEKIAALTGCHVVSFDKIIKQELLQNCTKNTAINQYFTAKKQY